MKELSWGWVGWLNFHPFGLIDCQLLTLVLVVPILECLKVALIAGT